MHILTSAQILEPKWNNDAYDAYDHSQMVMRERKKLWSMTLNNILKNDKYIYIYI